jgi:hypothetical protein
MRKALSRYTPAALLPAAITLATLALLPAWDAAIALNHRFVDWRFAVSLSTATLLLALVVWSSLLMVRRGRSSLLAGTVVLVTIGVVLGGDALAYARSIAESFNERLPWLQYWQRQVMIAAVTAGALAGILIVARPALVARALTSALQVLSPLPLLLLLQLGSAGAFASASTSATKVAERTVVWLVLDELDGDMLRKHLHSLPHFRWLQRNSIAAENAFPPGNLTRISVPSMLLGTSVDTEIRHSGVRFRRRDTDAWQDLSRAPNVFDDMASVGKAMSISGWHLPYCNMFGDIAGQCLDDSALQTPGGDVGPVEWLFGHNWLTQKLWWSRLAGNHLDMAQYYDDFFDSPWLYHNRRFANLHRTHTAYATDAIRSKKYDLVFTHMLCPHLPLVGAGKGHDGAHAFLDDYAENLAACDTMLGEILDSLNDAKYPNGYVLVVTSDHWFRCLDWLDHGRTLVVPKARRRVPVMIHSSTERGTARVDHTFNTAGMGGVVRRIVLDGVNDYARLAGLLGTLTDQETRLITW